MSHFYCQQDAHQQVHHLRKIKLHKGYLHCNGYDLFKHTNKSFILVRKTHCFAYMEDEKRIRLKIKFQAASDCLDSDLTEEHWTFASSAE